METVKLKENCKEENLKNNYRTYTCVKKMTQNTIRTDF